MNPEQIAHILSKLEFNVEITEGESSVDIMMNHATQEDVDAFEWPQRFESLMITSGHVDRVEVPKDCGVERMYLDGLALRSVYVPDSVVKVALCDNKLRHLELPSTIEIVEANNNLLRDISFRGGNPTHLCSLELDSNLLTSFEWEAPDTLEFATFARNEHMYFMSKSMLEAAVNCAYCCKVHPLFGCPCFHGSPNVCQ